jgi:hypothetical protein
MIEQFVCQLEMISIKPNNTLKPKQINKMKPILVIKDDRCLLNSNFLLQGRALANLLL